MPLIELENDKLSVLDAFPLSFTTREHLSINPVYKLEFQVAGADLDLSALLGEMVKVRLELPDSAGYRTFFTYVIAGFDEGQRQDKFVYRLEMSTWLWFLKQNRNCRIFQNINVVSIIEQVFARYSFADYRIALEGSYAPREYCVQFEETDLNFVSRLMEDEGIWFYFEHGEENNTLVITDRQQFPELDSRYAQLSFLPDSEERRAIRESIQRIQRSKRIHSSEIVLRDFDFLNPRNTLQTKVEENRGHLQDIPLEWYDYAAGYTDTQEGEAIARLRLEAMQSSGQLLVGESNATGLIAGHTFELVQHPDPGRNRSFKLISCDYTFLQDGPDSASQGRNVTCRFQALNDDVPYRPLCLTPSPQVPGVQSATVVGAKQSEVHTDQYARIRVHFHWDRYKTTEEDSSCWIRVVQAWAGKGWGVLAMPRVGQEVLVTYIDGDLDRPMVTGIVYNGENPPPYRLPEYINYSGLVSRSLRFGQPQHASQLTFDDNRGNERVMLHAERDLQKTVERNSATAVGQDSYETVERTSTDWVSNHISYTDMSFSITGMSVSATGFNASATGINLYGNGFEVGFVGIGTYFCLINTSFTGIATSFTGMSTSFTGASNSMTGVSNSMTGCSNSFTGCSNSMTGSSHSMTGFSSSMTGCSTSMTGSSSSFTGDSVSYTGNSFSSTGSSTSETGVSVSTTGSSTSVTGSSISTTGSSVSTTGSSISATGSSISTTGSSISTTGSSISTTGSSISSTGSSVSTTGSSISTTGSSISVTGLSISYNAVQYADHGIDLKSVGMQSKN
ncbi:type VI secretion system tip protein VgrG [Enterobacillus tribolii]|uniref:Type VI secretion system secreted protein VgrG n=1 Tax=Enterobacillus tribolii TaxID=1487935 RepID=A0A370QEW4_9GAMM|nr:type VI secretion system tip protein VgrG [Enterobacillus tribolii]MBW7984129.1 type VI secretion system tip protein VgrG [Enterobacillus tribolii]RDK86809.1 type VI secretion system secreted protein VgrG [Enterobacillus tribolii]